MIDNFGIVFSIIIPNHNNGGLLLDAIESVINQNADYIELIVIDDCSNDDSMNLLEKKRALDKHWYSQVTCYYFDKNQGLSAVRNFGVSKAKGEYLLFLDGDDFYPEASLKILYNAVKENNNPHVVIFPFNYSDFDGVFKSKYDAMNCLEGEHEGEGLISVLGDLSITPVAWNKAFRRDYWLENEYKFKEGVFYEDVSVIPFAWCNADTVLILSQALYNYRFRAASITNTFSEKHVYSMFLALGELVTRFNKSDLNKDAFEKPLIDFVLKQIHYILRRVKKASSPDMHILFSDLFFQFLSDSNINLLTVWSDGLGRKIIRNIIQYKEIYGFKKTFIERKFTIIFRVNNIVHSVYSFLKRLYLGIKRRIG